MEKELDKKWEWSIKVGNEGNIDDCGIVEKGMINKENIVIEKMKDLRNKGEDEMDEENEVMLEKINIWRRISSRYWFVGRVGKNGINNIRVVERKK